MIYTYRRSAVISRAILYIILSITVFMMFLFYPTGPWGTLFLLLLCSYALILLSAAFTHHSLTEDWLTIRQGIGVKIEVPLKNIKSCGAYIGSGKKLRTGVYSPWREATAYVLADPRYAVIVELTEPVKLPAVLWKKVDSIVFDVEQRDLFLKNLKAKNGCQCEED